jgi:hypothetical protein
VVAMTGVTRVVTVAALGHLGRERVIAVGGMVVARMIVGRTRDAVMRASHLYLLDSAHDRPYRAELRPARNPPWSS